MPAEEITPGAAEPVANPAAAEPVAAAAEPVATPASSEPGADWRSGLPDEIKNDPSIANLKTLEDLTKSYLSTQKLVGKKTVGLPDENSSEAEWTEFYRKLGVPEKVEDYQLKRNEAIPKEMIDNDAVGKFLAIAIKGGVQPRVMQQLAEEFDRQLVAGLTAQQAAEEAAKTQFKTDLATAYGRRADEVLERSTQALDILDAGKTVDREILARDVNAVKLLDLVATRILGDTIHKAASPGSLADLENKIAELRNRPGFASETHADHDRIMTEYKMCMEQRSRLKNG